MLNKCWGDGTKVVEGEILRYPMKPSQHQSKARERRQNMTSVVGSLHVRILYEALILSGVEWAG